MTDDIISLLREIQRDAVLMWDESQTIDQAVDEIERLRAELKQSKAQTESFAAIIRSASRNVAFVKYENDRQQKVRRSKRTNND